MNAPFTTGLTRYLLARTRANSGGPTLDKAAKFLVSGRPADGLWRSDSRTVTNAQSAAAR